MSISSDVPPMGENEFFPAVIVKTPSLVVPLSARYWKFEGKI
jgi:hypothetical protein